MCVMLGGQTANMAVPVVQHTGDAKPGGQHVKEEAPNDQQLFHELRPRSSEAVHPSTTLTELALIKAATVRMDTAEYSGEQKFQIPEDAPTMVAGGRKILQYVLQSPAMRRAVIGSVKVGSVWFPCCSTITANPEYIEGR